MIFEELKVMAHSLEYECISDREGDICVRRMIFNDEGLREVRYWPDPCEFVAFEAAEQYVKDLWESEQINQWTQYPRE